jgi:hypothetical protein
LSIVVNSTIHFCNPDGTIHWQVTIRNTGTCVANRDWKVQLQDHRPGTGGFRGVQITYGNSNFPPGDTVISGTFCYDAPQNVNSIRVEFTLDQPGCHGRNPHEKSPSLPPCDPVAPCPLDFARAPGQPLLC